jgi:hypothetical protein
MDSKRDERSHEGGKRRLNGRLRAFTDNEHAPHLTRSIARKMSPNPTRWSPDRATKK